MKIKNNYLVVHIFDLTFFLKNNVLERKNHLRTPKTTICSHVSNSLYLESQRGKEGRLP